MTFHASNSLQLLELMKNGLKNTISENIYQYSFLDPIYHCLKPEDFKSL